VTKRRGQTAIAAAMARVTMLRLFTIFLAFCLAIPALAMPMAHDMDHSAAMAPASVGSGHLGHGSSDRHDRDQHAVKVKHDCIGCVAPYHLLPTAPALLITPTARILPPLASALADARAGPETPPPKS